MNDINPNGILAGKTSASVTTEVKIDASMKSTFNFLWNVGNDSPTSYFSTDRFYLSGATPSFPIWDCFDCRMGPTSGTTPIFAFALDGLDATYVASGGVEGSIADRWSMDAVDGSEAEPAAPAPRKRAARKAAGGAAAESTDAGAADAAAPTEE